MAESDFKTRLVELLRTGHREEQAFVAGLSPAERAAGGTAERWAAKDVIAHITAWKARQTHRLDAALQGSTPPNYADENALNDETFVSYQDRAWEDVLAEADRVVDALIGMIERFPVADLRDPQRFAWMNGRPLEQPIVGNGYMHPQGHLAEFYQARGDLERATAIQEASAQALLELDDAPWYQGATLYNLACFYALTTRPEQAMDRLRLALALYPGAQEWARQDTDLDSLRDRPDYQALFAAES